MPLTPADRADTLLFYLQLANALITRDQATLQQRFFCAYPRSFAEMVALFGYDDGTGAAPLYDENQGTEVIAYFGGLSAIPDSLYYDKYIRLCIDGHWQADHIRGAFGLGEQLLNERRTAVAGLGRFSDADVHSIFAFLFDGPHPDHAANTQLYERLRIALDKQDARLSQLLTSAYREMLQHHDQHGH